MLLFILIGSLISFASGVAWGHVVWGKEVMDGSEELIEKGAWTLGFVIALLIIMWPSRGPEESGPD